MDGGGMGAGGWSWGFHFVFVPWLLLTTSSTPVPLREAPLHLCPCQSPRGVWKPPGEVLGEEPGMGGNCPCVWTVSTISRAPPQPLEVHGRLN